MRRQCTDRVHAIVVLQKKAGLVLGSNLVYSKWEFSLQLDNQSITSSQPETGCLFHQWTCKNIGYTVMVSAFYVGV